MEVIKKDGTRVPFDSSKIEAAVNKAAARVMVKLSNFDFAYIDGYIKEFIETCQCDSIAVSDMHNLVEAALDKTSPKVAKSYREYRNYKTEFVGMMDEAYSKAQEILYVGDRSNANSDSTLVSTQQSLLRGEFTKVIYDRFHMNDAERQACRDGFIYIHDKKDRIFTSNCCIMDIKTVLEGGFHSCNFDYTEPKGITAAMGVVKNIIMMGAAQQYGK